MKQDPRRAIMKQKKVNRMTNSQAKLDANARYDAKTYKLISIKLRLEDDADIIADFQDAHDHGISSREWIRALYEAYNTKREK